MGRLVAPGLVSVDVRENPVTERFQQSVLHSEPQSPMEAEKLYESRTSYVAIEAWT
jgi:hypothetical protein